MDIIQDYLLENSSMTQEEKIQFLCEKYDLVQEQLTAGIAQLKTVISKMMAEGLSRREAVDLIRVALRRPMTAGKWMGTSQSVRDWVLGGSRNVSPKVAAAVKHIPKSWLTMSGAADTIKKTLRVAASLIA